MKEKSLKLNFIMNAIFTMSSIVFPLITFPYLSRTLLVEGNGKISFATSVVTYFTMFATLGLPTYGVRACAQVRDNKEKLSKTVQELLIISAITTVITYVVFFTTLFVIPEFAARRELLIIMGLSIGLSTIGVQWFYNALEQYSYITTCAIIFKIIGLILMFFFVHEQGDYLIYGGIYVIASFGSYVLNFIRLRKFISFHKTGPYELRKHVKSTLVFFALAASSSIYLNLDVIMLGFMKGDHEVGIYNAGVKVKTVLVTCVTSLGTVLLPRLSYYIQKDNKEEFQRIVVKAFKFVLIFGSAVMVYFMVYAREAILLLAGEAFLPAVIPMIILMPTVLLIGLSNITGIQVLTPTGEEKKVVYSVTVGALFDFALNLIVIPKLGATGAAISTLLAEMIVLIIQCCYLKSVLESVFKQIQGKKIFLSLAGATILIYVYHRIVVLPVFWALATSSVLFFAIYGIFLLLMHEAMVMDLFNSCIRFLAERRKRD